MTAFKKVLIHDIQLFEFADIYIQTIAYGMFAARLHDTTSDSFYAAVTGTFLAEVIQRELCTLHLLENPKIEQFITTYPKEGDNMLPAESAKKDYELINRIGHIWINDKQYFDNIPEIAWKFYIGGYPPDRKWLKDRYSRQLERYSALSENHCGINRNGSQSIAL